MKTVQQQCDSMQDSVAVMMSSAQLRKINKPIVEKKRRERINACLDELKDLLLQSSSKHENSSKGTSSRQSIARTATPGGTCNSAPSQIRKLAMHAGIVMSSQSKLEKADILEMTVKHLRNAQRFQRSLSQCGGSDAGVTSYRDGYSDCAREVATYLGRLDSPGGVLVRTRVLAHLSGRLRAVNSAHRRQQVTPTSQRLPVPVYTGGDERCRVTTSCKPAAEGRLESSDSRLAAPPSTCLTKFLSQSPDGASSWSHLPPRSQFDALQRPATPSDDKPHVTTTVTSPSYDVNGNDVRTIECDESEDTVGKTSPAACADVDEVWRPW